MKTLRLFVATGWVLVLIATLPANGQPDNSTNTENAVLKGFYPELRVLFRKHYPKVTSHLLKEKMHFEHDTRIFLVHEPLKTGEWQDPWETRGPKPGGILCDITLQEGRFQGAAMVPQTFDKRYFQVLLMAPYSAKHDCHLIVHLSYPGNASGEFLKEFTELVNDYPKYVD